MRVTLPYFVELTSDLNGPLAEEKGTTKGTILLCWTKETYNNLLSEGHHPSTEEEYRRQHQVRDSGGSTAEYEITQDEKDAAIEVLKNGDPLQLVLDTVEELHVGDDALKMLYYLSGIGLKAKISPINIWVVGGSGKGKKLGTKMLHCFPEYHYKNWGTITSQALKYFAKSHVIGNKIHNVDEKDGIQDVSMLRTLTSDQDYGGKPTDYGTVKDQKYMEININEPVALWLTGVSLTEDEGNQIANRFIVVNVNESQAQDEKVHEFQTKKGMWNQELTLPPKIKLIQDISHMLLSTEDEVVIPYLECVDYTLKQDRRLWPLFIKLIKGTAKVYKYQRKQTRDGIILASITDFIVAKYLWDEMIDTSSRKITQKALDVLQVIPANKEDAITRKQLSEQVNLPYTTLIDIVHKQLITNGLVSPFQDGRIWYYWRTQQGLTELRGTTVNINAGLSQLGFFVG